MMSSLKQEISLPVFQDLLTGTFPLIREHVQLGYEILKDVESPWPQAEIVLQQNRGLLYDSRAVDTCMRVFREKDFQFEGTNFDTPSKILS